VADTLYARTPQAWWIFGSPGKHSASMVDNEFCMPTHITIIMANIQFCM
jgi:hypothetical protein